MRAAILGFAAGVWWLQHQPQLPPGWMLALMAAPAAAALFFLRSERRSWSWPVRAAAGMALGFAWAAAAAHARLADALDPAWEGRDLALTGVIAELPQPVDRGARFEFAVESVQPAQAAVPRRVLLAWYNGLSPEEFQEVAPVRAGERWRLTVRLRRPHGLANPHGFDYEAWLLERDIRATGYVRPGGLQRLNDLVPQPAYVLARQREKLRERFWDVLPDAPHAGVLVALAIGEQRAIDSAQWRLFARTGVSHLMSISGLHVTMIAGLAAWLVMALWRRSERLTLRIPAQKAAAVAGFLGALGYCLLSGFAVPAQRTLYMVGVVALALWLNRSSVPSRVLALALALVLLLDPWAVLEPGFWLSFSAVAIIFYLGTARPSRGHWLEQWGAVQWGITVGLAPLMLVLFQQVSLVSPLANAVAIPLVSFVITPLAIAGAVLPFDFLLHAANFVLESMMPLLEQLAQLDAAVWQQHAPVGWTLAFALVGSFWLLAPRGFPARSLALVLFLPLFFVAPDPPGEAVARITFLDVGQGMAVAVRTRRHALTYDAGPAWGPGSDKSSDSGMRVVVPYLRGEGVDRLDAVIVSHDDSDHSGGAGSVLESLPAGMLISSLQRDHPIQRLAPFRIPCRAGLGWEWDGVRFRFLHPGTLQIIDPWLTTNDRSCVLKIEAARGSVLLAGDIGRLAEQALLARDPAALRSDLVLAPHHGGVGSSSDDFVSAVAPSYAVFSVGYRNRFGHPKEDVVERYRRTGAVMLRSDRDGAMTVELDTKEIQVHPYRDEERRYWHGL